jgi:hypothetical protein
LATVNSTLNTEVLWKSNLDYVYDSTNNLFAEINFGPKKSSYFGKNEHPQDYLYGRVVRVKPSFNQYHK